MNVALGMLDFSPTGPPSLLPTADVTRTLRPSMRPLRTCRDADQRRSEFIRGHGSRVRSLLGASHAGSKASRFGFYLARI
jgi:hypothetical protein